MPGLLKIGRTDRQPELRARELRTTGVPQPFVLEHYVQVANSSIAEAKAHELLQRKGARMSPDREFFNVGLGEAIEILDLVAGDVQIVPDFSRLADLAELAATVSRPSSQSGSFDDVENAASELASIARRGCPWAMREAALLFEHVHPHGSRFKDFWREYMQLQRAYSLWIPLSSSNGKSARAEVGRATAEYIYHCASHQWLIEDDFSFVSQFLSEGDQFQYEGYLQNLSRYPLSEPVAFKAREV